MASHPDTSFGDLLRRHRQSAGMTQEELAERAEISARGLRYLETDVRLPYRETLRRIAAALELRPEDASELFGAARARRLSAPGRAGPVALPPLGAIIGREVEVSDLCELLRQTGVKIVCVTGPGGVGKTRLAVEVATCMQPEFADGVFWVPLADLDDPALVAPTIAQALGAGRSEGSDRERITARLAGRCALLVLDNFEHLLGAVDVVATLVPASSKLKVLATSRAPLRLRLEHEYRLLPLQVPHVGATADSPSIRENPAIELFTRRARAIDHRFTLTDGNAETLAEVCRRLDGMPLALELAAARVRTLSPGELLGHLGSTLDLLTGGPVDAPARQRTLRDTLAWSCRLLPPAEQRLLWRMAVFSGGCTLLGAEAVGGYPDAPRHHVLDALDGLQRSSLVSRVEWDGHGARFVVLETVRQYALERLSEDRDSELDARNRHAVYYAGLALELAESIQGPGPTRALVQLEQEHDNLRVALRWWLHTRDAWHGLRVAGALWMFWYLRGYVTEGRAHLAAFLALPEGAGLTGPRALALLGAGQLARAQGDLRVAEKCMTESLALSRAAGDAAGLAAALLGSAFVAQMQGDNRAALLCLWEGLPLARAARDRHLTAATLHHLGMVLVEADPDYAGARAALDESLALYQELESPRFIGLVLASTASLRCAEGDRAGARALLGDSLRTMLAGGEVLALRWPLNELARLEAEDGMPARATQLAAAAAQLEGVGGRDLDPRQPQDWLIAARLALGEPDFRAAWSEGRAMSPEDVVALAANHEERKPTVKSVLGETHARSSPGV